MRFCVLGSIARERHWGRRGANIPMAKWLAGLIDGLLANGIEPEVVGHCYQSSWPRGRFWPDPRPDLDLTRVTHAVRFSNLPFVRPVELSWLYNRKLKGIIARSGGKPGALLTYNPYPWHLPGARLWKASGGLWINIVLDYDESRIGSDWCGFDRHCGDADGQVFLSWWAFTNYPGESKLFLDAGVRDDFTFPQPLVREPGRRIVLYVGKLSEDGGTRLMVDSFLETKGDDVVFRIAGLGNASPVVEAAKMDPRIEYLGYVDDQRLEHEMRKASVFINPRDPRNKLNRMIFPSKLLHYLSYGNPVVSTWTDGLSPEYRRLLDVVDRAEPAVMAKKLREVLNRPEHEIRRWRDRAGAFLRNERSWKCQSRRLVEFANTL